jgi:hypothetical protein
MATLINNSSPREDFLEKPPFPLAGAAVVGVVVVVNVASTVVTLLSL